MSDEDADGDEPCESKRRFRWTLEIGRLNPWKVSSIKYSAGKPDWSVTGLIGGDSLTIDYMLAMTDDLQSPVDNRGVGKLSFLTKTGDVTDEYDVHYDGMKHIPFLELDYMSSDPIVGRIILYAVRIKKRVDISSHESS